MHKEQTEQVFVKQMEQMLAKYVDDPKKYRSMIDRIFDSIDRLSNNRANKLVKTEKERKRQMDMLFKTLDSNKNNLIDYNEMETYVNVKFPEKANKILEVYKNHLRENNVTEICKEKFDQILTKFVDAEEIKKSIFHSF